MLANDSPGDAGPESLTVRKFRDGILQCLSGEGGES
jgi:hypothetical protein